jgi:hypothetical protein
MVIVDRGEVFDLLIGKALLDPEESEVTRLGSKSLEEVPDQRAVPGPDRANTSTSTVTKHHIELVLGGVPGQDVTHLSCQS